MQRRARRLARREFVGLGAAAGSLGWLGAAQAATSGASGAAPRAGGTAATPAANTASPGRTLRWLDVATLSDGSALRLPLHELRGRRSGPTLGVTAAVHGWEILGIEVVRRLLLQVGEDFAGRVLAVPLSNPPAFRTQSRHSPLDSQDLDHVFPGSAGGWITQRIAHALTREVIEPADFYVDVHGGDHSCTVNYAMGSTLDVALLSGFPVVRVLADVFRGSPNLSGTTVGHAMQLGKPAMGYEVGAGYQADELCIETAKRGILNAMRSLGMITGPVQREPRQWVIQKTRVLRVSHGGLFLPALGIERMNQPVAGGTVLGRVVDPATLEVVETLTAPWPRGVLMMHKAGIAMVEAGVWVFNVGDLESAREIVNDAAPRA